MEIKEISERIWLISANKMKKNSESVSKQSSQLKLTIVTYNCSNGLHKLSSLQEKLWICFLIDWKRINQNQVLKYAKKQWLKSNKSLNGEIGCATLKCLNFCQGIPSCHKVF